MMCWESDYGHRTLLLIYVMTSEVPCNIRLDRNIRVKKKKGFRSEFSSNESLLSLKRDIVV